MIIDTLDSEARDALIRLYRHANQLIDRYCREAEFDKPSFEGLCEALEDSTRIWANKNELPKPLVRLLIDLEPMMDRMFPTMDRSTDPEIKYALARIQPLIQNCVDVSEEESEWLFNL